MVVDVRGRGDSEGAFEPFFNDGPDGYDLVEWLASQPYCNGSVGMHGGSYGGMTQWATARERPGSLRSIVPVAPSYLGFDIPAHAGVIFSYWIQWLTLTRGRATHFNGFGDSELWRDIFTRLYCDHEPFSKLDEVAGSTATKFQEWLAHSQPGEYWEKAALSNDDYAGLRLPILSVTGLFDGAIVPTLEYVRRHAAVAPAEETARHFLVIGPWDHAGTRVPKPEIGGIRFGPHAMLDINELHRAWYAWTMEGADRPSFLKDRFLYYVTGAEEWRYASSVDAATNKREQFFLEAPDGRAHDVFSSGRLATEASDTPAATFRYDPLDTRPAEVQPALDIVSGLRPLDQTAAHNLFGNGLVYHSSPIEETLVLTGVPEVHLFITLDVPDTDLQVALHHVMPDGSAMELGVDMLRARYRRSMHSAELVIPGRIEEYVFTRLPFVSRRLEKYSRFRLVVSCPNSPYTEKNYNSGGDVALETAADARPASVTVHHAAPNASYIVLPFGEATTARRLSDTELAPWIGESK
jgi:putative CocE/NonD family hydrolase